MNSSRIGSLVEHAIKLALLSDPTIDALLEPVSPVRYDLTFERDGHFYTVQCKKGTVKDGVISFRTCSVNNYTGERTGYKEIDFFGVHCIEMNSTYLIPVAEAPSTMAFLRVMPPRNCQQKGIRLADKYRIGT